MEQVCREGWGSVEWTDNFTLLHRATADQPELRRKFIEHGADPTHWDMLGRNALDYACASALAAALAVLERSVVLPLAQLRCESNALHVRGLVRQQHVWRS